MAGNRFKGRNKEGIGMNNKEEVYTGFSQEQADKIQKYLKEISRIYGIRLAEIGELLGKKLKNHRKGEHQWFMAFMIISDVFDEMERKLLIALEEFGAVGPLSETNVVIDMERRNHIKSIIQETQALLKEELPLPKQD